MLLGHTPVMATASGTCHSRTAHLLCNLLQLKMQTGLFASASHGRHAHGQQPRHAPSCPYHHGCSMATMLRPQAAATDIISCDIRLENKRAYYVAPHAACADAVGATCASHDRTLTADRTGRASPAKLQHCTATLSAALLLLICSPCCSSQHAWPPQRA